MDRKKSDSEKHDNRPSASGHERGPGQYLFTENTESPQEEEKEQEFDWLDILAFIIAAYQIILPLLGAVFGVFLLLWGVLWLISIF